MTGPHLATGLLDEHEIAQVILDNCRNSGDEERSSRGLKNRRPAFHAAYRYGHANYQAIMVAFRTESWLATIRTWNPQDSVFRQQVRRRRERIEAVANCVAESERWKHEELLGRQTEHARPA
jgi:hypothetical protein